MDLRPIMKAAQAIHSADYTLLMGRGISRTMTEVLSYRLGVLGVRAVVVNPEESTSLEGHMNTIDEHTTLVALTFPRYLTNWSSHELAAAKGAKVVAITDSPASPIVPFSHTVIYCPMARGTLYNSFVPVLTVINLIAHSIAIQREAAIRARSWNGCGLHWKGPILRLWRVSYNTCKKTPGPSSGGSGCPETYITKKDHLPYLLPIRKKPRPVRGFLHLSRSKCTPKACMQTLAKTRKSWLFPLFQHAEKPPGHRPGGSLYKRGSVCFLRKDYSFQLKFSMRTSPAPSISTFSRLAL